MIYARLMAQPLPPRLSELEYLALERAAEEKHEFVDGYRVPVHDPQFGTAGASFEHNVVVANILRELGQVLDGSPCLALPSDMKVKAEASRRHYCPDATVVCGPPVFADGKRDVLLNPSVVVEVLSDSTERRDRGEKAHVYRSIPSCTDYLLRSTAQPLIEHHTRDADGFWRLREYGPSELVPLSAAAVALAVDRVYQNVFEQS